MATGMGPSEFGGKQQKNRVQPRLTPDGLPGHEPTVSERLMLVYTTGDESGLTDPDNGAAWNGLLPIDEQVAELDKRGLLADVDPQDIKDAEY